MNKEKAKQSLLNIVKDALHQNKKRIEIDLTLIDKIYYDFEEELKKAYIEGSNDAWKARNESIEKAIVSVEDSYGWMTYEDKQNCIEILYGLRG